MQIIIVSLQGLALETRMAGRKPGLASDPDAQWRLALQACEESQSLALMTAMRDGGQFAPFLVCLRASRLHQKAVELGLPLLAISGSGNFFDLFRLWRWQRHQPRLLIQTVGRQSIRLGQRLQAMRKPGSSILAHAFFLAAPDMADKTGRKAVLTADKIFCGSDHVRARILSGLCHNGWPKKDGDPARIGGDSQEENAGDASCQKTATGARPVSLARRIELLPPGADLCGLGARPQRDLWQQGRHFVFCMANSLVPRSGALVVVRAMAAIWQFDDLPAWEVRMFGLGPRYHEIIDEAVRLGVQSRLCLLAEQAPTEMTCHCHAWLAPGSSTRELPESLWLGPAAGLPLIASNSDLHRERLLLEGQQDADQPMEPCRLFAANDPQALARAMRAILQEAGNGKISPSPRINRLAGMAGPERMAEQAIARYGAWLEEMDI